MFPELILGPGTQEPEGGSRPCAVSLFLFLTPKGLVGGLLPAANPAGLSTFVRHISFQTYLVRSRDPVDDSEEAEVLPVLLRPRDPHGMWCVDERASGAAVARRWTKRMTAQIVVNICYPPPLISRGALGRHRRRARHAVHSFREEQRELTADNMPEFHFMVRGHLPCTNVFWSGRLVFSWRQKVAATI